MFPGFNVVIFLRFHASSFCRDELQKCINVEQANKYSFSVKAMSPKHQCVYLTAGAAGFRNRHPI